MIYQSRLFRYIVFLILIVSLLPVTYGAKQAWDQQSNRVEDWLPETFDETQDLKWFVDRFGSDELIMVSWKGATLDDPRLKTFARLLLEPVNKQGNATQLYRKSWTGGELLQTLTTKPIELDREEALQRMQGWLLGPDQETTAVIGLVSEAGAQDRRRAIERVWEIADKVEGLSRESIHLAGPTYDGVAIDEASKNSLLQFNIFSFIICVILIYVALKSLLLAGSVFLTASFAQQLSMAVMYYSGVPMDSVLLLVTNLTFVLTIAGGVHLTNYYLEACRNQESQPVSKAVQSALWPTTMASTTTALGMISLCVSRIAPIQNFGFYASISIVAATLILFIMLPVLLQHFLPRAKSLREWREPTEQSPYHWRYFAGRVVSNSKGIVAVAVLLLVGGFAGASRLETSARLHDFFQPEARIIKDYNWLEEHVANLIPIEIVVEFPKQNEIVNEENETVIQSRFIDQMEAVGQLRDQVEVISGLGGTVTAEDFAPPVPEVGGFRQMVQRRIRTKEIYEQRSELAEFGFWKEYEGQSNFRISLRVTSDPGTKYGPLLRQIQDRVYESQLQIEELKKARIVVAGGVPLVFKAQATLLDDLIMSFGLALIMIGVVMMFMVHGVIPGILTMIPNMLPSVIVFGVMGWWGVKVEIGSLLTATAAMGIAVDDTLHFLTWFRKGKRKMSDPQEVLVYAYRKSGIAMIHTSLICSLGLVVFAFSSFVPISRFAWLMFTLLLLALVCDLVVLPAILLVTHRVRGREISSTAE